MEQQQSHPPDDDNASVTLSMSFLRQGTSVTSNDYIPDNMSTTSTTNSLVNRIDSVQISTMKRVAEQHNSTSHLSIQSEMNGAVFDIPYSGNNYNQSSINYAPNDKKHKAWWSQYGYGMRLNDKIYCTLTRRQPNGCKAIFSSNGSSTSSFLLHLKSKKIRAHNLDEIKHKAIMDDIQTEITRAEESARERFSNDSSASIPFSYQPPTKESIHNSFMQKLTTTSPTTLQIYLNKMKKEADATYNLPFNRNNFKKLLLDFHITNQLAFKFIDHNTTLQNLLNFCVLAPVNSSLSDVKLPCRQTLAAYTKEEYEDTKRTIKLLLSRQASLNFTTDIWTSELGSSFMAVTCHFIETSTWEPVQITLALRNVDRISHNGENMAQIFIKILEEFNCLHLLHCITADNASNNRKMAEYLEKESQDTNRFQFNARENLIPCFAHIINLVAQAIINNGVSRYAGDEINSNTDMTTGSGNPAENDLHAQDDNTTTDDDSDIDSNNIETSSTSAINRTPIQKLRLGCKLIKNGKKLYNSFIDTRKRLQLPNLVLKKDCPTRWNSTKDMIQRFLVLQDAYHIVISACDASIRNLCHLAESEIEYLKVLNDYLDNFYIVTLFLCSQRYTTINKTVVLINELFDFLETFVDENADSTDINIQALVGASKAGRDKLDKYYSRTDDTSLFACSTMLDCDLKYNYWRDEEWETPVVNEQEAKCRQAFEAFAVDLHSKQLVLNHQRVQQQNTTSTTTAQHQTTVTPSNSSDTSGMRDTAATTPTISSSSSAATSTTTGGSTIVTKSFGCSGKRRMKMKATEANKKYRTNSTTLNELVEASMNELALYTNTDDSQQFPLQELRYEGYVIGDNTVSSGQEDDININEDGYSSVNQPGAIGTESSSSSTVTIQSRYLSSRVHKSHLHNSMQFATQCLKYWKAHDLRYPTLSAFALKILAVPSTSVASERLFSTAKRIINTNRSNLSVDAAESSVVLSLWKKETRGLVI